MIRIPKINNIKAWLVIIVIVVIIQGIIFSDASNVQSAHEITLLIKPCKLIENMPVEVTRFNEIDLPLICGEVLSEYLPLELDYYIINSADKKLILSKYLKITARDFYIELPANLNIGKYKFEIKAGMKKVVGTASFEITP